ncbi:MAG: sodium:alanine symporter family protein [Lachnospiraceae bacterium]|nr:sodium:alanine symporter family protein [Lachnospiraceae bacterium]
MTEILKVLDAMVWGPVTIVFLLGTGLYLMLKMRFMPLRNLGYALRCAVGGEGKRKSKGKGETSEGDISPFAALMTELAATIGTGNIVGVATAMVAGGPGALLWMMLSALIGMSTKLAESTLSVKYRICNEQGEMAGGPMYVMACGLKNRRMGRILGTAFALFAVFASFGMGNMTQSNSISQAMQESFGIPAEQTGLAVTLLTILVVLGGIGSISRVTRVVVPGMAVFYILGALVVIAVNLEHLPRGILQIVQLAFSPKAVAGGVGGTIMVSMQQALRWGVARGVFTNEAGLGAAGISAAAAHTDEPVRQGYISMTGVFLDTMVICMLTGLAIAASGMLGRTDASGELLNGAALTMAAFSTAFGKNGGRMVGSGIVLFAFATILGWEYQGERAFEFLAGLRSGRERRKTAGACLGYRFVYALMTFVGAVCTLETVWCFSDIMNALMAVPNLIGIWMLSEEVCRDVKDYQSKIELK